MDNPLTNFTLCLDDAVNMLSRFDDESLDLVVTDPPYESLEKHRKVGTTTRLKNSKASSNKWFDIFPNSRFEDLFEQVWRVLKPNTHFYMFCDQETMFVAKPLAENAGFRFWKPLIWDKVAIGMGYHYRARYEVILFFEKGKRKLNNLSIPDILTAKRVYRGYPTEKPTTLAQTLIEQSTQIGDVVCDPFMGSGSTGVGALSTGRFFIGSDTCQEAVDVSRERLEKLGMELANWPVAPPSSTNQEEVPTSPNNQLNMF